MAIRIARTSTTAATPPICRLCNYCGESAKPGQDFLKCAGCDVAWYCEPTHQQYDWKRHKIRCKAEKLKNRTSEHQTDVADSGKLIRSTEENSADSDSDESPPADPGTESPKDAQVSSFPIETQAGEGNGAQQSTFFLRTSNSSTSVTEIPIRKGGSSNSESETDPVVPLKKAKTVSINLAGLVQPPKDTQVPAKTVETQSSGSDVAPRMSILRKTKGATLNLADLVGTTTTDEPAGAKPRPAADGLVNARRFFLGGQTLAPPENATDDRSTAVDHSKNRPYSVSLSDHIQNCATASVVRGASMTQYQAFCLRIQDIAWYIIEHLNEFGWCVIDSFLGEAHCAAVTREIQLLYSRKLFDNRLESYDTHNEIFWYDNKEENKDAVTVGFLISMIDSLVIQLEGKIPHKINGRAPAMLSCYPGNGTKRTKAVENSTKDGRCITATFFINKNWTNQDGGVLRIFPNSSSAPVEIEPLCDRLVIYWSNERVPNETLPAFNHRFSVHVWYFDAKEKAEANMKLQLEAEAQASTSSAKNKPYPSPDYPAQIMPKSPFHSAADLRLLQSINRPRFSAPIPPSGVASFPPPVIAQQLLNHATSAQNIVLQEALRAGVAASNWEQTERLIHAQRLQAETAIEMLRGHSGSAFVSGQARLGFAPRVPPAAGGQYWGQGGDTCVLPTVRSWNSFRNPML